MKLSSSQFVAQQASKRRTHSLQMRVVVKVNPFSSTVDLVYLHLPHGQHFRCAEEVTSVIVRLTWSLFMFDVCAGVVIENII